jgi:hypothetical protein
MAGCGVIPGLAAPPCLPPEYSVSPAEASPGRAVTVSAPDAGCDPRYGSDAQIEVIVTDASGAEVVHETAPMNDGGGFTYTFTVPSKTAAGEASVTALPYNVDWCDDTGRNNRVSGALGAAGVELERVSCAMPLRHLLITRSPLLIIRSLLMRSVRYSFPPLSDLSA